MCRLVLDQREEVLLKSRLVLWRNQVRLVTLAQQDVRVKEEHIEHLQQEVSLLLLRADCLLIIPHDFFDAQQLNLEFVSPQSKQLKKLLQSGYLIERELARRV